jgi:hypothetical protein
MSRISGFQKIMTVDSIWRKQIKYVAKTGFYLKYIKNTKKGETYEKTTFEISRNE